MTTRSGLKFAMMFAVSVGLATLSSSAHALGISAASANGVGCVAITNGGGNGVGAPGGTSVDFTLTVNETVTCLQWDIVLTVTGPPKTLSADELGLTKNSVNNSGIDWIDLHMILGTGTGGAFVQPHIELSLIPCRPCRRSG